TPPTMTCHLYALLPGGNTLGVHLPKALKKAR
ncbi:hypothetical protein Y032_0634g905, partial [Ancylostoma ceylanicum]